MKPGSAPVACDSEAPTMDLVRYLAVLLQSYNKLLAMEETFFNKDCIYF